MNTTNTPSNHFHKTIVTLVAILAPGILMAQDEAEHAALRKLRTAYEEALNSNQVEKLKPILAENFTGVMITAEEVKGFEELQAYWKKVWGLIGQGGRYQIKVNTDQTDFFGDISLSRGKTQELVQTGAGKEFRFGANWTAICQKRNGEWKILRVQGAMDPLENTFVVDTVRITKTFYGVGGLLLGIALGLATHLLRRSQSKPVSARATVP